MDQSMDHSWIPLAMRSLLKEDGSVQFTDIKEEEVRNAAL